MAEQTIARQDFYALARSRGWTDAEIEKAWKWARDRREKREAESYAAKKKAHADLLVESAAKTVTEAEDRLSAAKRALEQRQAERDAGQ